MVAALRHFAGNWDDKRELLCRSLEAVGGMSSGAAETLREADDELAAKIRQVCQ